MDYENTINSLCDRSLTLLQATPGTFDQWQLQILPEWITLLLPDLDPEELIAFIRDHKEYSFVYYDAFGKVCGKPREVAAYLLIELVKELVEEQQG
jgi:hypothetical protein